MAIELDLARTARLEKTRGVRGLIGRLFKWAYRETRASRERKGNEKRGFHDRAEQRIFEAALAQTREESRQERGFQ